LGLINSAFTKHNIVSTTTVLAAPLVVPAAVNWAAGTAVGRIALAIPGVVPAARIWLGTEGVKHGSQEFGRAYYGVGEDGRQLSTPERWVTGFNGLLAFGTSVFDLSGSIKAFLPTKGSVIPQISEYDGRMYAVPRDKSGNRLTQYGTGGGGYRNGDTGVHNQLSSGVNRASGNRNNTANGRIQSHHGVQTSNSHFKTFVLFSGVYQPCNSTIINDRIGPPTILAIKNMRTISIMRIAECKLNQQVNGLQGMGLLRTIQTNLPPFF
jgi:hypothetical protein